MKFYFAASGPDQLALLRKEHVDNVLVSIAKWRKKFHVLPDGIHFVVDSGAYTNTRPDSRDKVTLEDYEDIRENEIKPNFKGILDYIIMFDDPTSRELTIKNWHRHVEKGHDNAAFVDHLAFFSEKRDEIEKIYRDVDRVALSLPATPVEAKARPGAKSEKLTREELFERLEVSLALAKKHHTKIHLFAVMKPAILERFKFDAVDTAVWRNGSIYGNCFIYRRDQEGKIRPHWASYKAPQFKGFMADRFKKLGLNPLVDVERDRFNIKSIKAYEKYLNGHKEALSIIRKNFEFEELSSTSLFDLGDVAEKFSSETSQPEPKTFPALKVPSPEFNINRLKAGQPSGILSRHDRTERIGVEQALVNELLKPEDPPLLFGIVAMEAGKGPFKQFGEIPRTLVEGIDEFTRREFQTERKMWYFPLKLVRAFDPPLALKAPASGRRFASDIDIERDIQRKSEEQTLEVPEELRSFAVMGEKIVQVAKEEELSAVATGPEYVLTLPGMARPWIVFSLDSGIDARAQEQAADILRERNASGGYVCKKLGGTSSGLPVFTAKYKMNTVTEGMTETEQVLSTSPDDLAGLGDDPLQRYATFLHRFFNEHFADSDTTTTNGVSREDIVNAYIFVVREFARRGTPVVPKDQLDSEAKDLDAGLFVSKSEETAEDVVEVEETDLAPTSASGEKAGRRIELKEVLDKIKPFRYRQDAVMIVGGLANNGYSDNDIDILIRGPMDEETKHVLKFRLGRMLGPELSQRVQFLDDEMGGPFTNNVPLGNLVFERHPEFAVKQMRNLSKQDDPLQDLPKKPGKHEAIMQLHFRGKSVHGDLRLKIGDYLVGWTLALAKPNAIKEPVLTLEAAKQIARGYDPVTGNDYLKPFTAPGGVYATPKSRQPEVWSEITEDVFDPGEVGATRNFPAVFIAIDTPKIEFGRQSDRFHEYFFSNGKILNGVMLLRELVSSDEEEGGTPAGDPFWRMFVSKTYLPSILKERTVGEKIMPPDGVSWIPTSLEKDVPEEYRYWTKKGEAARKMRDALVEANIFTEDSVQLVDGEIRLVKKKIFVKEHESFREISLDKEMQKVDYVLSRQSFRGPVQVRAGFSRVFWWLVLDQANESGVKAWKLQTDPSRGQTVTAILPERSQISDKALLSLQGEVKPQSRFNDTKATPSEVVVMNRGKVDILDEQEGFLKLRFNSGPLKGIKILEAEESGSEMWQFAEANQPGEPLSASTEKSVDEEFKGQVPTRGGIQIWNPDQKQPDIDRKMLEPLAIFAPMKPAEGFSNPEKLLEEWAKPNLLKSGLAIEPKFNGYRTILEIKDGSPLIYFEDSKENRADKLPNVVKEMKAIESKIGPFIFDAELQDYDEEGNPQPRRTLGRFNGKEVQDDSSVRFKVFTSLFLNGKNKTAVPYSKLREELEATFKKLESLKHFDLVESKAIFSESDFAQALDWAAQQSGSEGAMVKMSESTYTLGRITDSWTKLKTTRNVKAVVIARELKKPSPQQQSPAKTYVYECAIGPIPEEDINLYEKTVKIGDAWYAPIGKTFATNVEAEVGDLLEVEFTELLVDGGENEQKKRRIHWFTPVVMAAVTGKPNTVEEAMALSFEHERRKFVDKILEKRLPIIKGKAAEEKIVYGVVLEPDELDAQQDIYSADEVRQAAHRFMEEFRHLGLMHRTRLDGRLKILETYIAPQELTINGQRVKKGTWLMVVRVLDNNLWNAVKEGKLTGFSIGGSAVRKPIKAEAN